MSDTPIQKCSVCDNKLRRLVSGGTGLIFKGSGFYLTDYAKNKSKNLGKSEDKKPNKNSTKKKSKK
jgi:predicted nucleic acid-binding Zn ribbon protein